MQPNDDVRQASEAHLLKLGVIDRGEDASTERKQGETRGKDDA
jgi:hypothetical protein